eukprot:1160133-Pelagomonas_calceolata.AAC.7
MDTHTHTQAVRAQLASAPVRSRDEDDHWLPAAWLEHWAAGEEKAASSQAPFGVVSRPTSLTVVWHQFC